nr:hypothetical protein [Mycoplasmopsis bovis]
MLYEYDGKPDENAIGNWNSIWFYKLIAKEKRQELIEAVATF